MNDTSVEIIRLIASLPTQTLLAVMIFRIYVDAIKGVTWLQKIFERLLDHAIKQAPEEDAAH